MLLPVHVSEVSVDITRRDVLQTDRTLCVLSLLVLARALAKLGLRSMIDF